MSPAQRTGHRPGRTLLITAAGLALAAGLTVALIPPGPGGQAVAAAAEPQLTVSQQTRVLLADLRINADTLTLAGATAQHTAELVQAAAAYAASDDGGNLTDARHALVDARRAAKRLTDEVRAGGADTATKTACSDASASLAAAETAFETARADVFDAVAVGLAAGTRARLAVLVDADTRDPELAALDLAQLQASDHLAARDAILHTRQAAELGYEADPGAQRIIDELAFNAGYANAVSGWNRNRAAIKAAWHTALSAL